MTERGLPIVDGAPACPFVAFADDRDERATSPDHRHRCYAEVEPAPRALAHQEAYCLSSSFPACPTFQDWARREAARARSAAVPSVRDDGQGGGPALAAQQRPQEDDRDQSMAARSGETPAADEDAFMDEDEPDPAGAAGGAAGAAAAGAAGAAGGGLSGSFADRLLGNQGQRYADEPASPPRESPRAGYSGVPADDEDPELAEPEEPVAPRRRREREPERESAAVAAARHVSERERDLGAPSWERPRRLEAYPTIRSRGFGGLGLSPIILGVAAVLLAGVALFLLPGFLGVGGPASTTAPRGSGAVGASLGASQPVAASTVPAAPTATVYLVQPGDTMSRIAKKFAIPLQTLIDANKTSIPNPDVLKVGDPVTIPLVTPTEIPAAS